MLKSKREVGAAYSTPLKKFRGHLVGYDVQKRKGNFAKETDIDVILNFSSLKVILSDSPYPYDNFKLILKYSDAAVSGWVIFEDSIATVLQKPPTEVSVDSIVGMDITLEKQENYDYGFKDKTGKQAVGIVWRTVEAGGKSAGVSPWDKALELLGGKSKGDFRGFAIADPVVKTDGTLINAILSDTFFTDKRVTDMYNVDAAGIYRKK